MAKENAVKGDIVISGISKNFGDQVVLNGFSAVLRQGTVTALMAPSGAGKTTLLNILLGLVPSDSGEITGLNGRKISAVFQEDRLFPGADAYSNVNSVSDKNLTPAELDKEFAALGLTDYVGKPVKELSGGMKRRIAIARALLSDYDFLVLDEPFKGLDEALKNKVIEYVKEKTAGKTVLLVTHDIREANAFSATVINL